MKRFGALILILILVVVIAAAFSGYKKLSENHLPQESVSSTEEPEAPKPAPDFTVTYLNGNTVSLSDFNGKPVVINFWATWCPPCKSELPYFENMFKKYGEQVEFMMVNLTDGVQETADSVNEFIEESEYTFPVYLDTEYSAAVAYGTYSIPVTVFVDGEGNLVYEKVGMIQENILEACIKSIKK